MKQIRYLLLFSMIVGHVAPMYAPDEPIETLKNVLSDHVQKSMELKERQAAQREDLNERIDRVRNYQNRINDPSDQDAASMDSIQDSLDYSVGEVSRFHNEINPQNKMSKEDTFKDMNSVSRNLDELHKGQRDALKAVHDQAWKRATGTYITSEKSVDMDTLRRLNREHDALHAAKPTLEEVAQKKQQAVEYDASRAFVPEAAPEPVVAKPIEKLTKIEKTTFKKITDWIKDCLEFGDVANARRVIKSGLVRRDVGPITMESKAENVVLTEKLKTALEKLTPEQRIDVLNAYFNHTTARSADEFKVLEAVNKMLPSDEQVALIHDRSTGEVFVKSKKQ